MEHSKRKLCEMTRAAMLTERASFDSHWKVLSEHMLPRRARFTVSDRNRGEVKNQKIIDSTAVLAARNLQAGMMSGLTSPARPWFSLTIPDASMMEVGSVKMWLDEVTRRMRTIFLKSNLYNALPIMYGDQGVFGTSAMVVLEDDLDVIRCHCFPIGSYAIAQNHRGSVDTLVRDYAMTVRQLVDKFGKEQVSRRVRDLYERGSGEIWIDVAHMIYPNRDFDPNALEAKFKKFSSLYWEVGCEGDMFLEESGFDEFPVMSPRWNLAGEDIYGSSPGMDALGDVKMVQSLKVNLIDGINKMAKPPMTAPTSMRNQKASLLPGDITYVDTNQGQQGFRPAIEVRMPVQEMQMLIGDTQNTIKRCFYEDLFLMLANSDRREITAREVQERHEEKLLMLGPVLERQNEDLLNPLIERTFSIMLRKGLIPPPPAEIAGSDLRVEYTSIMAQAQKLVATAGVERLVSFVGNLAGVKPDIVDKVDLDQAVDEYGEMLGVSAKIIRPDDEVMAMRQARAQAAAQQAQMEQFQQAAQGAKLLSQTDLSSNNALARIAGGLQP